jgi:hypothetical protein
MRGSNLAFAAGGGPPACGYLLARDRVGAGGLTRLRRPRSARVAVLEAKSGKRCDRKQHDPMLDQKLRHRYSFSLVIGCVSIYYRVSSLCDR